MINEHDTDVTKHDDYISTRKHTLFESLILMWPQHPPGRIFFFQQITLNLIRFTHRKTIIIKFNTMGLNQVGVGGCEGGAL